MSKKNFVRNARLVKGAKWYLDFLTYDTDTQTESRQRKDFRLNEIEDLHTRELIALHLIKVLDQIPIAVPVQAVQTVQTVEQQKISVRDAVVQAVKAKMSLRPDSVRSYVSISKQFIEWADHVHYASIPVADFSNKHIKSFLDWLRNTKEYRNRTLNNKINAMQAIWSEIVEREHCPVNVWLKQKRGRVEAKKRRAFTEGDKKTISAYIHEHEYWLHKAILLLYYCYIRQSEMCRLRFKDFDFAAGTITITEYQAKTHKKRVVTIPKSIYHHFIDNRFEKYPANFFIFGAMWEPNAKKALDSDSFYKRHQKIIKLLHERGDLADITGYTMYSWKDTGISTHAKKTSPFSTKDQAGHGDMAMTLKYYHASEVNKEYRELEADI